MGIEENVSAQRRWDEAMNSGDIDRLGELAAPDVIDHDPAPGQAGGPQGFKDLLSQMRRAFPDLHIEVDHMFGNGEDVAEVYTMTGTNEGPLMGRPPTGRTMNIRGVRISRFENGKLVERWGSSDQLSMLQQLGLVEL